MKPELQTELFERYPTLFVQHALGPMKSPMGRGIECDSGWFKIIETMCYCITKYRRGLETSLVNAEKYGWSNIEQIKQDLADCPRDPEFAQIKEKFGTLRVYTDFYNPISDTAVAFAEIMSSMTCEECGERGELRDGGWIRTLCDACHKKQLER